jgi:hypothetical protein
LTLAAVVVTVLVADGVAPPPPLATELGHGAGPELAAPELAGAEVAGTELTGAAVAAVVGEAAPVAAAVGDAVLPPPWWPWWPWPAVLARLAGITYAAAEAQLAFAASLTELRPE